uniref:Nidogen 2a (osteonidogen) n=1 Tax=Echeneis naucrates TaxID=173247 RepID=A0A665TBV2_ECHNA
KPILLSQSIQRADLFPYGTLSGDLILAEGDDETSKVLPLPRPLYFYNSLFKQLYVATNGIISAQDLPMEKQYVDDGFPTDFPVVAPFLADIDTSGGQGQIYYRVTETPSVLNRVAQEVHRGFPDAKFTPTHAVVATWENVAAYEDQNPNSGLLKKVNTFQAVIGYDETDSYVLFLYPEGGLNFFGTRPKESYNVEIELPARVGFSRGEITYLIFSRTEGPHYSVTSDEQSVKNLYQVGNTGIPGIWLFHTGNRYSFDNIVPASVGGLLATSPSGGYGHPLVILCFFLYLLNLCSPVALKQESKHVISSYRCKYFFFLSLCCSRFQQQCSQNAFCTDYATGFCCHCQPGFYGNGHHCLPEGAPQRVSGKVSGTVTVGSTPVQLNDIDLHAYIVVGDGRAYTAISEVPEPVGWALMPVAPIGELFGWLFALELPNSQAGFKVTGAEFTRRAELIFYPGNERLSITQTGLGLDDHHHLTVNTVVSGSVPFLPPGAEITIDPFKETYQYYPSVATSTSVREFSVVSAERGSESFSFQLKQNITYRDCRHDNRAAAPETLQITMERVFVMYVKEERILRYAITNKISPVGGESHRMELVNPCFSGNHDCDTTAQCLPLEGQSFQCQCATGYRGDGRNCYDIDECADGLSSCGAHTVCVNLPGSHRCQCQGGYEFGYDGRTCVALEMRQKLCSIIVECFHFWSFLSAFVPVDVFLSCFSSDVDECSSSPCHVSAQCTNSLGSFQCQCQPGFYGDGFSCSQLEGHVQTTSPEGFPIVGAYVPQCDASGQYTQLQCHDGYCWCVDSRGQERAGTRTSPGTRPTDCTKISHVNKLIFSSSNEPERTKTHVCERWRASLIQHYGGKPEPQQYMPQCGPDGQFSPVQCYGETTYCWCVDQDGREVPGTRSHDVVKPACLPSVAPPTVRPLPRPSVTPPPNTDITLLYAQGQKIGALPLNGTKLDASRSKTLLTLHGSIVVGIAYDCKDNHVYWTDLSARTINRASMAPGAEPEILINTNLVSPEGLAVDVKRRLIFWVDSNSDLIESANLDGNGRKTLFDTDLVNPRAIIVVSSTGSLYWTDWNREAPKIESSSVEGQNRRVVVSDGVGLPNALTYDSSSGQICWADAGTKRLECISPDSSGRRVIHPTLNYPFSMVYYRNHFYYTDWRRDGVIAVNKDSSQFTDEYLPDQRSHLYGLAIATTHCLSGETNCSTVNYK